MPKDSITGLNCSIVSIAFNILMFGYIILKGKKELRNVSSNLKFFRWWISSLFYHFSHYPPRKLKYSSLLWFVVTIANALAFLECDLSQGQHISFTQQIQQFMDTFQQFVLSMGEKNAADHISNSVFYISIGINDYIHYYLFNISSVQNLYSPWNFNQFLAATIRQEIKVIWLQFHFRSFVCNCCHNSCYTSFLIKRKYI